MKNASNVKEEILTLQGELDQITHLWEGLFQI